MIKAEQIFEKYPELKVRGWHLKQLIVFVESGLLKGAFENGNLMVDEQSFINLINYASGIGNTAERSGMVNRQNAVLNHLDVLEQKVQLVQNQNKTSGNTGNQKRFRDIYNEISLIRQSNKSGFGKTTDRFQEVLHSIIDLSFGEYFETIQDAHPDNFLNFVFESLNIVVDELYSSIIPKTMMMELLNVIPNLSAIAIDEDNKIEFITDVLQTELSYPKGKLKGVPVLEIIPDYDKLKPNQSIRVKDNFAGTGKDLNVLAVQSYATKDKKRGTQIIILETQWRDRNDQSNLKGEMKDLTAINQKLIEKLEELRKKVRD